jgi:hypothetical protein
VWVRVPHDSEVKRLYLHGVPEEVNGRYELRDDVRFWQTLMRTLTVSALTGKADIHVRLAQVPFYLNVAYWPHAKAVALLG